MKVTGSIEKPVSIGAVMTGGAYTTQRSRNERDFYPTPPEATEALMRYWKPNEHLDVWEPCAGNGALSDVLEKHLKDQPIHKSDIYPLREDITEYDFFKAKSAPNDFCAIITNPPFNKAEQFIRYGFGLGVYTQAMLLKSTYWHAKSRTPLFRQHRPSHVLALNWRLDFEGLGRPVMECVWVIWDKPNSEITIYDILEKPDMGS